MLYVYGWSKGANTANGILVNKVALNSTGRNGYQTFYCLRERFFSFFFQETKP